MSEGSSLAVSRYAVLPGGYWWSLLYGTVLLLVCLLVCLIGAHIYAKATFIIFILVMVVLGTIFVSFFAVPFRTVQLPGHTNASIGPTSANFTGFKLDTLMGNVQGVCELKREVRSGQVTFVSQVKLFRFNMMFIFHSLFHRINTIGHFQSPVSEKCVRVCVCVSERESVC